MMAELFVRPGMGGQKKVISQDEPCKKTSTYLKI
jgi:hypothetical protein